MVRDASLRDAPHHMLAEFIPKESLQIDTIAGTAESMQDAIRFKFLPAPLTEAQLKELIRLPPAQ
jgi:hypothetical protein